jgi:hypothetical protein
MNKRSLRRRYVVDWKLQGSLCGHGLLYGCLVLVVVSAGIFLPLLWNLGDAGKVPNFEEQAIVMLYMHERFWALAALCACVVVFGAIRFSHRIAGPLVRYKRNLRLLAEGKLPPPLRTRRADYLQEEVACLNAAVAGVETRVEAAQRAQAAVRRELNHLLARATGHETAQLAALATASLEVDKALAVFSHVDPGDHLEPAANAEPRLCASGAEALP